MVQLTWCWSKVELKDLEGLFHEKTVETRPCGSHCCLKAGKPKGGKPWAEWGAL